MSVSSSGFVTILSISRVDAMCQARGDATKVCESMEVEERTLADAGSQVLQRFSQLVSAVSNSQDESISDNQSQLQDELERFQLFAANLSLTHTGHSSLDYRLRESEQLQSTVRRLLQDLIDSLDEGNSPT
jgi:hypothetical protein